MKNKKNKRKVKVGNCEIKSHKGVIYRANDEYFETIQEDFVEIQKKDLEKNIKSDKKKEISENKALKDNNLNTGKKTFKASEKKTIKKK